MQTQTQLREAVVKIINSGFTVWGPNAIKPGNGWDAVEIAKCLIKHCEAQKVELALALAQGYVECHFGINPLARRSRRTLNIFNVGNVDSGANRTFATWCVGIEAYCRLMRREYNWEEGEYIDLESMVLHDFMRPRGGRYASAKNYTEQVKRTALRFRKELGVAK